MYDKVLQSGIDRGVTEDVINRSFFQDRDFLSVLSEKSQMSWRI